MLSGLMLLSHWYFSLCQSQEEMGGLLAQSLVLSGLVQDWETQEVWINTDCFTNLKHQGKYMGKLIKNSCPLSAWYAAKSEESTCWESYVLHWGKYHMKEVL